MQRQPIMCPEGTPATELLAIMMDKGVRQIPLVNGQGEVVDTALLPELKAIPLSSPDISHYS